LKASRIEREIPFEYRNEDQIWILEESSYIVKDDKPVIMLFSRNYKNKMETATHFIDDFEPYFYCPAGEQSYHHRIKRIEKETLIDAVGREIWKVVTFIPKDVPLVREYFTFTDMADFLFEKRFMVDMGIEYAYMMENGKPIPVTVPEILMPRILYFDIEVRSPEGVMPLPHYAKYPIVSIQTLDSYTNKIVVFTAFIPPTQDQEHDAYDTEEEMIDGFMRYLRLINPDVLSAWNSNGYDFPYIVKRCQFINKSCKGLARVGYPFVTLRENNKWDVFIKGRSTLDMIDAFKKMMIMKSERESYALKEVSKDYGFEYVDYGPKIDELYNNHEWEKFIEYGKNDVKALKLIDEHPDVMLHRFYETLRMICGTRLDDTMYNSRLIEMKLLRMGIKPMPTKKQSDILSDKFEGALVLLPQPGIHNDVGTVDLAALYPTIMRAFPDQTSPDNEHKVIEMLEVFVAEREKLRTLRNSGDDSTGTALREYAYKVLANSVYGVVGARTFRLYKRQCAEFVTSTGREVGYYLHYCLKKYNKNTIYGDSVTGDSLINVYDIDRNETQKQIQDLFTDVSFIRNGKEYCSLKSTWVKSFSKSKSIDYDLVEYVMRHKVNKAIYQVILVNGFSINVTEDHSVFIYRPHNGTISTIKTTKLVGKHVIIQWKGEVLYSKVESLKKLDASDIFVYDLHTEKNHNFFANDILVHNTDSAFFYPVKDPDEGKEIEAKLNTDLLAWGREKGAKVPFTLKFEKLYRCILFKIDASGKRAAKKKYCGHLVWEEGKDKDELNFKGLELKRSDQSLISKTCLRRFLELSLIHDDVDSAMKYVKEMHNKVMNGDVSLFDVSIPKAIRKVGSDSPHARGIQNTRLYYNYVIQDGSKPRLLYLKEFPKEVCIDEEMNTDEIKSVVDWNTMVNKTITMKMQSYVTSANRNWDEVIYDQANLNKWF